jgi:uncharacterized protein (TIGR03437 family)
MHRTHTRLFGLAALQLLSGMLLCGQVPSYFIRTVAGVNPAGDGGPAKNAVLNTLGKVVADSAGNVYIAEQGAGKVRRVSPNGLISTVAGGGGATPALQATITPYALAVDNSNNLYIGDLFGDCDIWRVNLTTSAASVIAGNGSCAAGLDGPALSTSLYEVTGLALDASGGLLFSERYSGRVRRLDLTKLTVTAVMGTGSLGNGPDGKPALQTALGDAEDVKLDSSGDMFVVDNGNCVIRKLDSTGLVHIVAGQSGSCGSPAEGAAPLSAQFGNPSGLAVDAAGDVLYLVQGNGSGVNVRVSKIDLGANKVTTYAGTGVFGDTGDGGPANKAPLGWAVGVALYQNGGVLVSEYTGFRVRLIDSSQNIQAFAGTANRAAGDGGPAQAAFLSATTAFQDGKGGFVVNDSGDRRVRAVSGGVISLVAGTDYFHGSSGDGGSALSAGLFVVDGMTVDPAGPIYIAESTGEVRVIKQGQINKAGSVAFNFPMGLALDPAHQFLYIAEYSGDRVVRLNLSTGTVNTIAGLGQAGAAGTSGDDGDTLPANQSRLNAPVDLAVDAAGNVYVMDSGNSVIRRINPSSNTMVTVVGNHQKGSSPDGTLATSASITIGGGLTVDTGGNIFYVESSKIRRVDASTHTLATVAGSTPGFSGDGGAALSAQLNAPSGLNADPQGNIYLADNGRIRVLSPQSTVPLIAAPIVAANYGGGSTITPGTWIEIYGQNLSTTTRTWAASDFNGNQAPNSLDNVKVLIGGQQGYIDVVSPTQVNAQVPDSIGSGNVNVQVTNSNGSSNTVALNVVTSSPALLAPPSFTAGGKFYVAAQFLDQTYVGPANLVTGASFRPAKAGDTIVIYGIGFGAVTPPVPAGMIDAQPTTSLPNFSVTIGGVPATAAYAGLANGYLGLDQFDIVIPGGLTGDAQLSMSVNGVPLQQTLFLNLQ